MKKTLIDVFILFILFSNIIVTQFNLPYLFETWDVILEIVLVIMFIIKSIKNKKNISTIYFKCYIILFLLIIDGVIGNLLYNYASSYMAIFKDILSFLKFPLTFLLLKNMKFDFTISKNLDKYFYNILKIIIIIIFLCGVISFFKDIGMSLNEYRHGIRSFTFLFLHPTYLVISMVFVLALFEHKGENIKNKNFYELLILSIIGLTMRTKGFAIIAIFLIMKYFGKILVKYKMISIFVIFLTIFLVGYNKLVEYMNYASSAREILYKGSITLFMMCFPFGSGFGTFASHVSGQYMSKVYDFINIKYIWEIPGNTIAQLGDTGFPYYIGQFGILGIILLAFLSIYIIRISLENCKNKNSVILLFIYILIGLTSESTVLNFGSELAVILAIVSSDFCDIDRNEEKLYKLDVGKDKMLFTENK